MDRKETDDLMSCNSVFMRSLSTHVGLFQTVQSLAQAAVRSPEPVKSAVTKELGEVVCLMQRMVMIYGDGTYPSQCVPMHSLSKVAAKTCCDVDEVTKDLKILFGDGARVVIDTLETWADQVLNAHLWEKTAEALKLTVKTA